MVMDFMWQVFENYDELVSVVDIDAREIVFLNKKFRERIGLTYEESVGKPCYEIICGRKDICARCRAEDLTPYVYNVSFDYDTNELACHVSKTTLLEKEGKRLRFEIGVGMESDPEAVEVRNLEATVNKILKNSLRESTPDASLNIIIRQLGLLFKAERAYIFEKNPDNTDSNTYEWVAEGVSPEKDNLQNVPPETAQGWYDAFNAGKTITIENIEDVKEEDPVLYATLKPQHITSLVVVPLYSHEKIIGFFGVDNPEAVRLDFALDLIEIMCHFIVANIERRKFISELENISYTDQLTGFGNRYALTGFKKYLTSKRTGIVFCDIVGLKHINDTQGHASGDAYIKACCEDLKECFEGAEFFRVGGDELVVVLADTTKTRFLNNIKVLKKSFKEKEVNLSIGSVYVKGELDFDKALQEAENLMYEDKDNYYRKAGIDRRG